MSSNKSCPNSKLFPDTVFSATMWGHHIWQQYRPITILYRTTRIFISWVMETVWIVKSDQFQLPILQNFVLKTGFTMLINILLTYIGPDPVYPINQFFALGFSFSILFRESSSNVKTNSLDFNLGLYNVGANNNIILRLSSERHTA